MYAFRLASSRYLPDNSEGAKLYGGRWNAFGTPVIYSSSTKSLAALEVIVHHGGIPVDYQVILIEIPDALPMESIQRGDLPGEWPDSSTDKDIELRGDRWAKSGRTPVLKVPSAVILSEHNYILNPLHAEFTKIRFTVLVDDYVDPRLRR